MNLPTLPLLFLHPQNQARFVFDRRRGRDDRPEGVEVVEEGDVRLPPP